MFLRNWRSTLVSAVALPTSVIGTFAVMQALGFTFNVVTMLALTLSIGLLIDDAIVVIENIIRHLEEGATPFEAAYEGTKEIALAVLAVTLSIVAVFIPVAFMDGMMGKFFYQFGVTVAVAVVISYFVSMTLTPMLSSRLLKRPRRARAPCPAAIEKVLTATENVYRRALRWMLDHRAITMAAAVGVLFFTLFLARFINFTFMPAQDMSMAKVTVELPVGHAAGAHPAGARPASAAQIDKLPGVASVYAAAGGGVQEEVHKGELLVNLVPISERSLRPAGLQAVPAPEPGAQRGRAAQRAGLRGGQRRWRPAADGAVQHPRRQLEGCRRGRREDARRPCRRHPGFVDVDITYRSGKPQLSVDVDRERAASVGVPAAMLGTTLRAFLGGDAVTQYREGGDTYDVKVKLPPEVLADPDQVGALTVRSPMGQLVELRNLADIRPDEGPSQIDRQAQKRQITVLADLRNYCLGEAIGVPRRTSPRRSCRPTVITDFEGQGKELAKAGQAFLLALLLGIILVYMILAAQFGSLLDPITIMMSLPFAHHRRAGRPAALRPVHVHVRDDRHHHAHGPGDEERHPAGGLHQPAQGAGQEHAARRCSRRAPSACAPS